MGRCNIHRDLSRANLHRILYFLRGRPVFRDRDYRGGHSNSPLNIMVTGQVCWSLLGRSLWGYRTESVWATACLADLSADDLDLAWIWDHRRSPTKDAAAYNTCQTYGQTVAKYYFVVANGLSCVGSCFFVWCCVAFEHTEDFTRKCPDEYAVLDTIDLLLSRGYLNLPMW